MDLAEFSERFKDLKQRGFIRTKRRGPTGIGFTLETVLGIRENNIAEPDLEKIELKAHRIASNNMITLFTFNRKAWRVKPLDAIRQYGSEDRNGRLGLYYTMSLKPNQAGLFLYVTDETISVRHISGEIIVEWDLETLAERFELKIPALILVSAFTEERDGVEYFHYFRAQYMTDTTPELLANQFRSENILVDLRLHDKGTRARNHGTGFRAYEDKLPHLFKQIRDLD